MSDLKEAAKAVANSKTMEEKLKALSEAYLLFSEETDRLKDAYEKLQGEFKLASAELEESNLHLHEKVVEYGLITEYLDTILLNISQGILFVDLKGVITTFNPAAEKILGIRSPLVLFDPFWEHFDDGLLGFSMHEALLQRKAPKHLMISLDFPEIGKRNVELETTFVDESGGKNSPIAPMQGFIILLRDTTEIKALETLAQRNSRLKELGEMAAAVAHEIRNPLGGIKGFASLLYRDLADRPPLQRMAKQIIDGTDRLNQLVTQVLQYARPIEPQIVAADIMKLLKDLIEQLKADETVQRQSIEISLETKGGSVIWNIDPNMIRSAMLNLLVNSVQAMPQGGTIQVKCWEEKNDGYLQVTDTGIGIKKELTEKIFSPFFTTRAEGTGFGLSEVYKIVQVHHGTIHVDSSEGLGSTFTITVPIQQGGKPWP